MYSHIDANKRKTWILVVLFSAFVVLLIALLGWNAGVDPLPSVMLGTGFAIGYAAIAFFASDKVALFSQGAKPIKKEDAPDLYRLVENLSITAGLPMPKVYIIPDDAPNAFATGRSPKHASIAVTTGLLQRLERVELEGVLAHEMAHIQNFDIRLMTIVVVLVGMVVLISDILIRMNFLRDTRNKQAQSAALIFLLVGLVLGLLSPLIARIIKLAISRSREYLADASGALLTRHPEGLARALEKIRSHGAPLKRANHATAHLYISSPFGERGKKAHSWYQRLFRTHPPIDDRIAKLRGMMN